MLVLVRRNPLGLSFAHDGLWYIYVYYARTQAGGPLAASLKLAALVNALVGRYPRQVRARMPASIVCQDRMDGLRGGLVHRHRRVDCNPLTCSQTNTGAAVAAPSPAHYPSM